MAVENVVCVAGVFIGQGPDQGLPGHFARLSRPHQPMTDICFSPEDQLMDHISCWGMPKGKVGARPRVEEDPRNSST